jgi:hypothetical protein
MRSAEARLAPQAAFYPRLVQMGFPVLVGRSINLGWLLEFLGLSRGKTRATPILRTGILLLMTRTTASRTNRFPPWGQGCAAPTTRFPAAGSVLPIEPALSVVQVFKEQLVVRPCGHDL